MHGDLVGRVFANVNHPDVEDQVLALDTAKRAFGDRRFFQVEADSLVRVGLDRVGDFKRIEVDNQLDRLQAETLPQFVQTVGALVE